MPAAAPAAKLVEQRGGAWIGSWPPDRFAPQPEPYVAWDLGKWTSGTNGDYSWVPGYHVRSWIDVYNALHFKIPRRAFDGNLGDDGTYDLPPGQYVVPFRYVVVNLNHQECPTFKPQIWAVDDQGNQVRIILERGSELTVRFCGQVAAIRVRELKASDSGDIYAELERVTAAQGR